MGALQKILQVAIINNKDRYILKNAASFYDFFKKFFQLA